MKSAAGENVLTAGKTATTNVESVMTDKKTVIFGGIECDATKADSLLLEEIIPMAIRVAESLAKDGCTKEKIAEGTAAAVEAVIKSLEGVTLKAEPKTANQEGRPGATDTIRIENHLGVMQFPASAITMLCSTVTGYLKTQTSIFVGGKEFVIDMTMEEVREKYLPHWNAPVVIDAAG